MTVKRISPQEAHDAFIQKAFPFAILDVRHEDEYEKGHVPGALLADVEDIVAGCATLPENKALTLFVYCRAGVRSAKAAVALEAMGYSDVRDFGGILDWPFETEV